MWELDRKEGWAPKNWCFWISVSKKTLESPVDCKEIKPVNPKGNESLIFIGRTDAEAEAPILWPPDAKSQLIRKDPDAEENWRQEEKGMTEDRMVGWHHWLDGHEIEQAPGDGERQGSRACCSPWGHKQLDTTKQQNNNNTPFKHLKKQDPCSSTHQQSCLRSLPHEDVGGNPASSVEWCERRPKCHHPSLPPCWDGSEEAKWTVRTFTSSQL